jgi:hypothetical protein
MHADCTAISSTTPPYPPLPTTPTNHAIILSDMQMQYTRPAVCHSVGLLFPLVCCSPWFVILSERSESKDLRLYVSAVVLAQPKYPHLELRLRWCGVQPVPNNFLA